jgi:hypothetical protein
MQKKQQQGLHEKLKRCAHYASVLIMTLGDVLLLAYVVKVKIHEIKNGEHLKDDQTYLKQEWLSFSVCICMCACARALLHIGNRVVFLACADILTPKRRNKCLGTKLECPQTYMLICRGSKATSGKAQERRWKRRTVTLWSWAIAE